MLTAASIDRPTRRQDLAPSENDLDIDFLNHTAALARQEKTMDPERLQLVPGTSEATISHW